MSNSIHLPVPPPQSQDQWRLLQHRDTTEETAGDGSRGGGGQQFYFILNDIEQRYCLYRISESEMIGGGGGSSSEETTIKSIPDPILRLDKATFPKFMSFVQVGSVIYMIGGSSVERSSYNTPIRTVSTKVYRYDSVYSTFSKGPSLKSGKAYPLLFNVHSKIYALSKMIYCYDRKNPALDPKPRFEVLDTRGTGCVWSSLPEPTLYVTKSRYAYSILASVGYGSFIFISVQDAGTYVFDVIGQFWKHISSDQLPFVRQAKYVSECGHPMCYGKSANTGKFCAYRIHYQPDDMVFSIDEIEIDKVDSGNLLPSCPMLRTFDNCSFLVPMGDNRVYFILGGLDKPVFTYDHDPSLVSRYIKVSAFDIKNIKKKKKSKKRQRLQTALEGCSNLTGEPKDMSEEGKQRGNRKLRMSPVWRTIYKAGPMTDFKIHITSVFAM